MLDVGVNVGVACNTKLVPSYCTMFTPPALISPFQGSLPSSVLILLAHGQKSTVQAPVFAVVALKVSICPTVYVVSAGVNATT